MKTFIVAGASSGIGLAVCSKLTGRGDRVIMIARDQKRLEMAAAELGGQEKRPLCFSFDFTKTEEIAAFADEALGSVDADGLVYCVGNGNSQRLRSLTYDVLLPLMKSNFFSFVELLRVMIGRRKSTEKQFNAVAVSSLAATHANARYYTGYTSSKAALEGAIRVLASELALKNCAVSAVKPGYVDTPRIDSDRLMHPDLEQYLRHSGFQPGGIIPPEAVADLIVLMLDSKSMCYTGSIMPVAAGAIS